MPRHTQGPWTRRATNQVTSSHTDERVAQCYPLNGSKEALERAFANARLIAEAPEMFAILKTLDHKSLNEVEELWEWVAFKARVRATITRVED